MILKPLKSQGIWSNIGILSRSLNIKKYKAQSFSNIRKALRPMCFRDNRKKSVVCFNNLFLATFTQQTTQ